MLHLRRAAARYVLSSLLWLTLASFGGCSDDPVAPGGQTSASGTSVTGGSGGETPTGGTAGMGGSGGNGAGGSGGAGGGNGGEGGGNGGTGGSEVECTTPRDCAPPANECLEADCVANLCEDKPVPSGTVIATQDAGDCQTLECDGAGATTSVDDDDDLPDDNNECTQDLCTVGVPTNPFEPAGTSCGAAGAGLECDGAGQCLGCADPDDCPGPDNECQTPTCSAMVCGLDFEPLGTVLAVQTTGDCQEAQCGALGAIVDVKDDLDVPDDADPCTADVCTNGVPSNTQLPAGTPCPGGVCDASGACIGCLTNADCGTTTECKIFTCMAGTCGSTNIPDNTPLATQIAADCQQVQCDGNGGIETVPLSSDIAADGTVCTSDICSGATPQNPPVAAGTPCSEGTGTLCNGSGNCVQCLTETSCGVDTFCRNYSCTAGTCSFVDAPAGAVLPVGLQTPGDCQELQCNGMGSPMSVESNADIPVDAFQCTDDICMMGSPANPDTAAGAACTEGGGSFCDGTGECVECLADAQCTSLVCDELTGTCMAPTCLDLVQNGSESDIDCGGASCPDCLPGDSCNAASDCTTNLCTGSVCQAPGVLSTNPGDAQTGVALASPISITFNTAMNPGTLTTQTAPGTCTGSLRVSSDNFATCIAFTSSAASMSAGDTVATLTPTPGLAAGLTYRIRVTTAALGAAGDALGALFTTVTGFSTVGTNTLRPITIAQLYGAGGNAGALFTNDYVVLHNWNGVPVTVQGWSIQYASSAGTTWTANQLFGSIPANGFYLLQLASGGATGVALPTPNAIGSINMAAASGKIALVSSMTALAGTCPTGAPILDFVGFGAAATCFEGTGPTGNLSATLAAHRDVAGCLDDNNTATDFRVATPVPINSSAPMAVCGHGTDVARNETDVPLEADYCALFSPASFTLSSNQTSPSVSARIYEAGVTEAGGASPSVTAQLGYGRLTHPPTSHLGWAFVPATFDAQFGNDDQYLASFRAPVVPGLVIYEYTYRFSLDGGASWTYCDLDGAGSNAGLTFSDANIGVMTVTP